MKDTMQTTQTPSSQTFSFHVPYALRHLQSEIKERGGRFVPDTREWSLSESDDNRAFAAQFAKPKPRPQVPKEERVRNVAQTAAELLNSLKIGQYRLVEATTERVLLEKQL